MTLHDDQILSWFPDIYFCFAFQPQLTAIIHSDLIYIFSRNNYPDYCNENHKPTLGKLLFILYTEQTKCKEKRSTFSFIHFSTERPKSNWSDWILSIVTSPHENSGYRHWSRHARQPKKNYMPL